MTNEQIAANNLIDRAMNENKQSAAFMLIDSAYRLDSELPVNDIKSTWLNQWIRLEAMNRNVTVVTN